ncbi:MAG TPA: sulfite exporter TauE/SafE family protein, partial [Propionibacteriaceae bacterium]
GRFGHARLLMCRWPPKPRVRCLRPESWRESSEVEVASRLWCRTRPSSSSGVFARVVPFLVAAGVIILMIQPALMKLPEGWVRRTPLLQLGLVGAVCVYGGYFGAGSGVMLLAVILVLVDSRIAPANAIKNVLLGVTSLVAAAVFIATGPVLWAAVLPLAGGLLVGSALGPIIVRHLPPNLVRWMAATFGFILAIYLWIRPP